MSKNKCKHRSFWQQYWMLNSKKVWKKEWLDFVCGICGAKCHIIWSQESCEDAKKRWCNKKIWSCIIWMLPAVTLITWTIWYYLCLIMQWGDYSLLEILAPAVWSILVISIFHFAAMYFLIHSKRLIVTEQ